MPPHGGGHSRRELVHCVIELRLELFKLYVHPGDHLFGGEDHALDREREAHACEVRPCGVDDAVDGFQGVRVYELLGCGEPLWLTAVSESCSGLIFRAARQTLARVAQGILFQTGFPLPAPSFAESLCFRSLMGLFGYWDSGYFGWLVVSLVEVWQLSRRGQVFLTVVFSSCQ